MALSSLHWRSCVAIALTSSHGCSYMPNPQLIGPLPESTPAELRSSSRGRARDLPPDLLREASRRLGIVSLLAAVLWLVATVFGHLAYRAMTPGANWMQLGFPDAVATAAVIVSLALFAYTRRSQRDPRFILDLGLGYMIFTAFALSVTLHSGGAPSGSYVFPMITWVGVAMIMFAAIVPSTPRKTLIASLVAASMNPVSMLVEKANGTWDFGPWTNALVMHYPDFLLVGVAVVISHVVTRLGQQVSKAREMGSYHLGELLGSGGMGEVYKATHRMLARPAAIKLIRPEMLGAGTADEAEITVARFRREAEAAANLRSPHTVEVYDFGVTEDETIYIVMELLEGLDLESLVREQGPLPASRVIHVLRQVCDSLEEAHTYGLVHRDIKPANIHPRTRWPPSRLCQSARLWFGQGRVGHQRRSATGHRSRPDGARHTRLHVAGDGAGRESGWAGGHLRIGMRRVFPPHRSACVPGREGIPDDREASADNSSTAVGAGPSRAAITGALGSIVPRQGPEGSASERGRAVAFARLDRCGSLERGKGYAVVGGEPARLAAVRFSACRDALSKTECVCSSDLEQLEVRAPALPHRRPPRSA